MVTKQFYFTVIAIYLKIDIDFQDVKVPLHFVI